MWRGLEKVKMIRHGTQPDPELIFDWIKANYWTIEDYLYDLRKWDNEDIYKILTENQRDFLFNKWLKNNFYEVEDIFQQVKENNIL